MAHIKIKKGLDIPIEGEASGSVRPLEANGRVITPTHVALNVSSFEDVHFKLLAKPGDRVKAGQALLMDKTTPERVFVSPGGGVIQEVRRGKKRRLLDIVIQLDQEEEYEERKSFSLEGETREKLVEHLLEGGFFTRIWQRPFRRLADPHVVPRAIFVKAIESAPFVPSAEMIVEGHEVDFQGGLDALSKLTDGSVHLVFEKGTTCKAFSEAMTVERHTAEGPHPIGTHSVHIHWISPIQSATDVVWTLDVQDVIAIGHYLRTARPLLERVISIAGPAVLPEGRGFFRVREGIAISNLISGRVEKGQMRFVSGDLLTGEKVEADDFLGFFDHSLAVIRETMKREFLHFFRLGIDKFTASGAYFSGLFKSGRRFDFTTSQHGEKRAFIIGSPYDQVMPMRIPTMHLVKAVMAEDFDLAEELGFLEVDAEDFALATFVCPSKIEMVDIIKKGLKTYAKDVLE